MAPLKVGIVNVAYSPNLGDGLIAECLRHGLASSPAQLEPHFIDLAGRESFSQGLQAKKRLNLLRALLPGFALGAAARVYLELLVRFRLRPFYRRKMAGLDAIVLGGGNLLADQDLNFPRKVHGALMEAARRRLPVYLYGVGVSDDWSPTGRRLFLEALGACDLRLLSVRDARSATLLARALGTAEQDIATVLDPGVFAALALPPAPLEPPPSEGVARIGVGVMSPAELRYHGLASMDDQVLLGFYRTLLANLAARGAQIRVFTNGSPEDRAFAQRVTRGFSEGGPVCSRLVDVTERIQTPADLCRVIAGCTGIVAFRLHALIAALAYDKPFVALAWDKKVAAFLHEVQRPHALADVSRTSPSSIVDRLLSPPSAPAPLPSQVCAQRALRSVHRLAELIAVAPAREAHEPQEATT